MSEFIVSKITQLTRPCPIYFQGFFLAKFKAINQKDNRHQDYKNSQTKLPCNHHQCNKLMNQISSNKILGKYHLKIPTNQF